MTDRQALRHRRVARARRHYRLCGRHAATPRSTVLAEHTDPKQQHYLNLYKMGDGPLYSFFTPYHLVHFEVHNSRSRESCCSGTRSLTPLGGPVVEVCAVAKRDLQGR